MNALNAEQPRRPGRPKREEATNTERRRRKGGFVDKLAIPDAVKRAHPGMEFRWGLDDEGRMERLTQNDDWDKVPGVDPIHAGRGATGNAIKHHLLMKPTKFMEEDRAEKLRFLDERDNAALARPEAAQALEQGADMYSVPGNKL